MEILLDAADIAFRMFAYGMAGYFGFRTVLWTATKYDDWASERRIAREVEEAKRKGYPTLLDVMRLRDLYIGKLASK